ncbi:MAG: NapC/NirT family cytochrome c [Candidatus Hydrogenedentes bacterium]|nr:NapC/NirT family cytochrome c [Candidatus Hydrogenedentota bacterium]
MRKGVQLFFGVLTSNAISLFGATLVTIAALFIVFFMLLSYLGHVNSPYLGILVFLILPTFFVIGLVLVPAGALWRRRQRRIHGDTDPELAAGFYPVLDFNRAKTRQMFTVVGILTLVNLFTVSLISYQGVVYSESPTFCGQVCHTVMEPEYTAYLNSPHSHVACVDCHIGPGASWFVKAKLSGLRQVIAVARKSYSTPIETPVHNLRPSEETCEECHWPKKFSGDSLRVHKHYLDDESNTPSYTVLLMHLGGGRSASKGIHSWHISEEKDTYYLASDEKRQKIDVVRVQEKGGALTEYRMSDTTLTGADIAAGEFRRMDCIDCHNRPTHIYKPPATLIDYAITDGSISKEIPFIRMKAVEEFTAAGNEFAPWTQVDEKIRAYYAENNPEVLETMKDKLDASLVTLERLYRQSVFPEMKVKWDTYPDNIGHTNSIGCFRCHDDSHASSDGKVISQDCNVCHTVLAWEEEAPEILNQLEVPQ